MADKKNNNTNNNSNNSGNKTPIIEINSNHPIYSQQPVVKGNSDTKPKPSSNVFGKKCLW